MDVLTAYRTKLSAFAEQAPRLLNRHPETVEEARLIGQHIAALDDARLFRLAVTGKLKRGKSTLINALIGRPLPTIGVVETTATLNFIGYGEGEERQRIRLRWKDQSLRDSDEPLAYLQQLQGEQGRDLAQRIASVFLSADAEFLRNVQIIDTPGEMGTQIQAIDVKADALIRSLPFVAEDNDLQRLGQYGDDSRPFGFAAYNTIAVIQMWEGVWPPGQRVPDPFEHDPFEIACRGAKDQREILGDAVSEVLPVSGLLELFSICETDACLTALLEFNDAVNRDELITLLKSPTRFLSEDCAPKTLESRRFLNEHLKNTTYQTAAAWPLLKMAIWAMHRDRPTSPQALRASLHALSNMDALKTLLEKRFFGLSELIQIGGSLNKALSPSEDALNRLRKRRETNLQILDEALHARQALAAMASDDADGKQLVLNCIAKMEETVAEDSNRIFDTCQQVSALRIDLKKGFEAIQQEVGFLHALEGKDATESHWTEIRRIFGQFGIEDYQRLGCEADASPAILWDKTWKLLDHWRTSPVRLSREMKEALIHRLTMILDGLKKPGS